MMRDPAQILIVEDDPDWLEIYQMELEDGDYAIATARSVKDASAQIRTQSFDVVITDLRLIGDDMGGMSILHFIRQERPDVQVILFTAYGSAEYARQALRDGAYDYLTKPLDYDHARLTIKAAITTRRQLLKKRDKTIENLLGNLVFPERFLFSATPMRNVISSAAKQAERDDHVLIIGPRGTGKGLLAEAIHFGSSRDGFLLVNCTSLSERTLERNVFGHTDTNGEWQSGYLQTLTGGTLVLDGISGLSRRLQVALSYVLQNGVLQTDEKQDIPIDVRIISLDTEDLVESVAEGLFDETLYNQLAQSLIQIPPLRERRDERHNDILQLSQYFITKYGEKPYPELTEEAREALVSYAFPGNVRELQKIIRRLISKVSNGRITLEQLPSQVVKANAHTGLGIQDGKVLCPHGNFHCDQTDAIQQGYQNKRRVYLRLNSVSPSGFAEQAHLAITRSGFTVQRQVSTDGKRVPHCRYCMPIQMSHYAIIDLSSDDPTLLYELGLVHSLGLPVLFLKQENVTLTGFLNEVNSLVYQSVEQVNASLTCCYPAKGLSSGESSTR